MVFMRQDQVSKTLQAAYDREYIKRYREMDIFSYNEAGEIRMSECELT